MPMGVQDYVDMWFGDELSFGYQSVWIAQEAARILDPPNEVRLIRRFYPRPVDAPVLAPTAKDDLEDVPLFAIKILTLGYRFHKEAQMAQEQQPAAA